MIVLKVIRNEWKNLIRSKIAIWLLSILTALLLYTFWQATSTFNETLKYRHEAKEFMRNRFVSQGEVNPHSAVHYGHFVYKPLTLLSIIDEGTNPFTGVSLYLEGHQQNEPLYSTAQQSSSSIRFGLLRLNLILQVLFPLFILFACHNVISKEKEENTLFISLSQGLSLRNLVWSKILAYSIIWWVALLLIVSILSVILLSVTGSIAFERLTGLLLSYGIYYFIITALAVYVSARGNSSGNALLLLLAFWVITTVILPKAASNIGENSKPLISRLELER